MNQAPPGDPIPLSPSATVRPGELPPLSSSPSVSLTSGVYFPDFPSSPAMIPANSIKISNVEEGTSAFDQDYPYPVNSRYETAREVIAKIEGLPVPESHTPENKISADAKCDHSARHLLSSGNWFCRSCYKFSNDLAFWGRYDEVTRRWGIPAPAKKNPTADAVISSHVFGPWTYNPDDVDWGFIRDAAGLVTAIAKDNRVDQAEMAKARREKYDPYEKQARLIAAAPDLLIALKDCTVEVKRLVLMLRDMEVGAKVQIEMVADAEKAITKAEWGMP